MDGGAFIMTDAAYREVTPDQFSTAQRYAIRIRDGIMPSFEEDRPADNLFPAGRRMTWNKDGAYGAPLGVRVKTETGARYWLASHVPVKTDAEWLGEWGDKFRANLTAMVDGMRTANEAEAARRGITVDQLFAERQWDERRERHRRAAQEHEDERRAIEGGSWLRNGKLSPEARAHYYGNTEKQGS